MSYKITATGIIHRLSDDAFIPDDPENVDYQEFLEWQAKGNTAPAEPKPETQLVHQTPAEKLAAAGLTTAELRELLGLPPA